MAFEQFALATGFIVASGLAYCPALWLPRRLRGGILVLLLATIFLAPWLISPEAKFLRFLATVSAVTLAVKLCDHFCSAEAGFHPGVWLYVVSLLNPFAIVLRPVLKERSPGWGTDLVTAAVDLSLGTAAIFLLIRIFLIDWRSHHFVTEHCAKAVGLFLIIQFLPNGLAAALRLIGIPSTRFGGPFFLARTPAEFWRLYNRPAGQFFLEYIFKPLSGQRHPIAATLLTFAFSGLVHEYVFDVPARSVLGTQMAFFLVQGIAAIATLRLRPHGWRAVPCILITLAFNLLTVRLFLTGVDAVVPFYVNRIPP